MRGVVALALLAALSQPALAHMDSREGDVTQAIALGKRTLFLPLVPDWHYHRLPIQEGKSIRIGPYVEGNPGPPSYVVTAYLKAYIKPDEWLEAERRVTTRKSLGSGWMAVSGARCAWVAYEEPAKPKGTSMRTKSVFFVDRGVSATFAYTAPKPQYDAGVKKFDKFLAEVTLK